MTDRELLELAAKAAGIALEKTGPWFTYSDARGFERMNMDGSAVTWRWNPLTDDGDALRLAVKLELNVFPVDLPGMSCCTNDSDISEGAMHNGDPYAATRRAIVRAAAEIAKGTT